SKTHGGGAIRSRTNQVTCPRRPATEMFSVTASPGSKEWSASPPTLTEAGCHCGQFAGVVMKSKTRSMGWRIWILLQMRVIHSFLRVPGGNLVELAPLIPSSLASVVSHV